MVLVLEFIRKPLPSHKRYIVLQQINQAYCGKGGCKDQEKACYHADNSTASKRHLLGSRLSFRTLYIVNPFAVFFFFFLKQLFSKLNNVLLFGPVAEDLDPYDLRQNSSALFPSRVLCPLPSGFNKYLSKLKSGQRCKYQD